MKHLIGTSICNISYITELFAFILLSCTDVIAASFNDNRATTPPSLRIEVQDKENFIMKLYDDYVFGGEDFTPIARKFYTEKLRKQLSDAYGYDCLDGECYTIWLFRSGIQDGPTEE